MMEESPVVIVGAGPAGLVLGLSLAKHHVHSIILEKEGAVDDDPRGVYLAGDAVRILYQLGLDGIMFDIGYQSKTLNFHKSSFKNKPFFTIDTSRDDEEQTTPNAIFQFQPKLENALRSEADKSPYCSLRCKSQVISREETEDSVIVAYKDPEGTTRNIKCSYLIGADGKRGVVRKHFLEPTANIKQEVGLFAYTGTWVAANIQVDLPTPQTHPDLPFWKMNMSSEEIYDLFWPVDWHFCNPPGKPVACGRFGPREHRYWRHEFAEPDWNDSKDSVKLLWENILPMLTRDEDSHRRKFPDGPITYPQDCIQIKRCRPFEFCQKVVNKWFNNRTILIGDAAHVFPPFGGQGIACGVRDADALSWRLAILLQLPNLTKKVTDQILNVWGLERCQGVDDSTKLTKSNGELANEPETYSFYLFRKIWAMLYALSLVPSFSQKAAETDKMGYKKTRDGFFSPEHHGGGKMAQAYVRSGSASPILSDALLKHDNATMTLLVQEDDLSSQMDGIMSILRKVNVPPVVLSEESIVFISTGLEHPKSDELTKVQIYKPCSEAELGYEYRVRPGYNEKAYWGRLPKGTKYAIIRADKIIFGAAKSLSELEKCLVILNSKLGQPTGTAGAKL